MMTPLAVANGTTVPMSSVPTIPWADFAKLVRGGGDGATRIAALTALPEGDGAKLVVVVAHGATGLLAVAATDVGMTFPSLTPECPAVHWFERDIFEREGIRPDGHPWLKPNRFPGGDAGSAESFQVTGDEVHEVAVGPVHAGVIEPGHFRFACRGEEVMHLEVFLGYQHRGVEAALRGGPCRRTMHYIETLAGDTTVGHATAYCSVLEALAGCDVPARAQSIRAVALELERLANHAGDLGALAGDAGYLPTASYCGRLRGEFLNLTGLLCGSRFGRGLLLPGGVRFDLDGETTAELLRRLDVAMRDLEEAAELLFDKPSVLARFEDVGRIPETLARSIGMVGPAARASGLARDARHEFPSGVYRNHPIEPVTCATGDVFARAMVRWRECQRSAEFVGAVLRALPNGSTTTAPAPLQQQALAVSVVEGWRGEICHVALTDPTGAFSQYRVYDPSIHNWLAVGLALRGQQISDFPLCNKSFNLSYCGHDL